MRLIARTLIVSPMLVASFVGSPAFAGEAADPRTPVVLIGASGLTWADIDAEQTPAIASLMEGAAIGHLSVRSVFPVTCPVDAWLTVGAARRAAAERPEVEGATEAPASLAALCPPVPGLVDARVDGWPQLVDYNATLGYGADLGLLGADAQVAGTSLLAVGPGAAVAAANNAGVVVHHVDAALAVSQDDIASSDITLIDVGSIDEAEGRPRTDQVRALDAAVEQVLAVVPADATVMLMAGGNSRPTADLQAIAIRGAGFPPGLLTSTSTKQEGLVLLTDVTPTLFRLAGIPADENFVGAPITSVPGDPEASFEERRQDLVDQTRKVQVSGGVAAEFFVTVTALQLIIYGLVWWILRRRSALPAESRRAVMTAVGWVALVSSSIPAGTFLANVVPWWRWDAAGPGLVGFVMLWALLIAGVAGWFGRDGDALARVGIVAGLTVGVLTVDIITGGHLQVASLMGYSPVVAGRLYGFGNVAFALFATSLVFLAAWYGDLRYRSKGPVAAARAILAIAVVGLLVDGLPAFGSDFGGMIALATGFGVFYLSARGVQITLLRLAATFGVGVVAVTVVSLADWLRPAESRSHLGTFVQQVLDGELVEILSRKATSNVDMLFSSVLTALVPLVLVALALALLRTSRRPPGLVALSYQQAPMLRPALTGWLTIMVVGFALNDSGVAIVGVGLMLAVPFLIVIAVDVVARAERRTSAAGDAVTEPGGAQPAH